jgi:hypothetical protein
MIHVQIEDPQRPQLLWLYMYLRQTALRHAEHHLNAPETLPAMTSSGVTLS